MSTPEPWASCPFVHRGPYRSLRLLGYALAYWSALFLAALSGGMGSLAYCAGVSVAAGWVGTAVFVVAVADLATGAAAVGWDMWGPGCVSKFRGAPIIGAHTWQ